MFLFTTKTTLFGFSIFLTFMKIETIKDAVDLISKEKGLTQEEIATELGYERTYFNSAINNGGTPKLIKLILKSYPDVLGKTTFIDFLSTKKAKEVYKGGQILSGDNQSNSVLAEPQPVKIVAREDYQNKYIKLLENNDTELKRILTTITSHLKTIEDLISKISLLENVLKLLPFKSLDETQEK